MDITWENEAADNLRGLNTVSSYFLGQFVEQLHEAAAAATAIRAFLQLRCCYSRVNTIRPQFITMLTGFRQRATTAA